MTVTNSLRIVPRLAVLSVMTFLLAGLSAFAQDDAFRKGIAARRNGQWADVESAMREAIAKDPKESSRKIGGLFVIGGEEYVPYFFLGEALFRRMECSGALSAWEESDRQGIARRNANRARTIDASYAQCEVDGYLAGTKFVKQVAEARAIYTNAKEEYEALTRAIAAYPDVKTDGVAQSNARLRISEASTRLASGERTRRAGDLAAVRTLSESATRLIRSARTQFESEVTTAVDADLAALQASGTDLFTQVEGRARTIEEALRERPNETGLLSEFTKLQTQVTRAHRNFDRAIRARDLASARSAALASSQLGPQVDDFAIRLGIVKRLVLPDVLARAAQALFDARYADVLATMTIETANAIEAPLRVHAFVIRAAALFALYEYSGARDNALRTQARESADLGRRLDSSFRPSAAVFSPRFITFFLAPPESAR
jgi:tetratricopeptide (TPR) repeat protein